MLWRAVDQLPVVDSHLRRWRWRTQNTPGSTGPLQRHSQMLQPWPAQDERRAVEPNNAGQTRQSLCKLT